MRPIFNQAVVKFALVTSLCLCSVSCRREAPSAIDHPSSAEVDQVTARPIVVSAAASTKEVMEDLAAQFSRERGVHVQLNFGGSNALAAQIINGAPADLFLSASTEWITAVAEADLVDEQIVLLENSLVMVTPRGNPAGVHAPKDLLGESVHHVALAGETVPAGIYADQALRSANLLDPLLASQRIVRGQDVRVTLSYVERGEADAGIVYDTDARASRDVEVVHTFDASTHEPITYRLAKVRRAPPHPAAEDFFRFLISNRADDVFTRRGFRRPAIRHPVSAEHP